MLVSILVATPHTAFGQLLRISLEDSGQYQVRLAQSAKEVRSCASHDSYQLVILDAALADEPFVPLCTNFLEQQPGVKLVIIPPDNNPNHPALGGLLPHGYLSRPFYLPELIDLVSRLVSDRQKEPLPGFPPDNEPVPAGRPSSTIPPWLQEPLTLRNYLEKELPETQAIAAIVALNGPLPGSPNGKGTARAYAGSLSDGAVEELTEMVFRYWNQAEKTDLMRFIRINADKRDVLVYATQITGEMVLILVYDTSAPLSQIRPRTKALAQLLATLPPVGSFGEPQTGAGAQPGSMPEISVTASEPKDQPRAPSAGNEPETQPLNDDVLLDRVNSSFSSARGSQEEQLPQAEAAENSAGLPTPLSAAAPRHEPSITEKGEDEIDGEEEEGRLINLSALLGAVPSPDPEEVHRRSPYDSGWVPERSASSPIPTLPGGMNGAPAGENEPAAGQSPKKRSVRTAPLDPQTIPRENLPESPALPVDYALPAGPETPRAPRSGRPASLEVKTEPPVMPPGITPPVEPHALDVPSDLALEPETAINPVEDTHPNVVSTVTSLTQLEPASPALSLLNYTCVLVPRLPQHYLTGQLADRLAAWVQQLCLAFGWRLEGISIRPEYLQWTVQVAPAISPGNLVRIVRQRTSLHVFGSYPHLAGENPSGDFWATGYLIVSGAQPPSAQLLRDYIAQTRKRQGVSK